MPARDTAPAGRTGGGPERAAANGSGAASGVDDTGWPEAARPGGAAVPAPAANGNDWPEPARPGGANPAPTPPAARPDVAGQPAGRCAGCPGGRCSGRPAPVGERFRTRWSGRERAAECRARGRACGGGWPWAPAPRQARTATADREWAGEPPYDPDYDGPTRSPGAGYEGFDPGDEPLDEVVDERTARQSSEQQAVQLLQQALGAERIGEIDSTK